MYSLKLRKWTNNVRCLFAFRGERYRGWFDYNSDKGLKEVLFHEVALWNIFRAGLHSLSNAQKIVTVIFESFDLLKWSESWTDSSLEMMLSSMSEDGSSLTPDSFTSLFCPQFLDPARIPHSLLMHTIVLSNTPEIIRLGCFPVN